MKISVQPDLAPIFPLSLAADSRALQEVVSGTDDSSPSFLQAFYLLRHLLGNGIIFGMHVMLLHFLHFHGRRYQGLHEGDAKNLNPLSLTLLQQLFCPMQSRRRGCAEPSSLA